MGSGFAGVKAGVLAGIVYVGGIAFFNVALLLIFQKDALNFISQNVSGCTAGIPVNGTSIPVTQCYDTVFTQYLPFAAFIGYFLSLFYAWIFGALYDSIPMKDPRIKGTVIALVVAISFVFLELEGFTFSYTVKVILTVFFVLITFLYGVMLGLLYKRYTKEVSLVSEDPDLRILVGRKDCTGKVLTFSARSVHKLTAKTESSHFKEWVVSGGVTVEDSRSFETIMEVNGNGVLKAVGTKG